MVPVSSQGEWAAKRFYGDPKLAAAYLPVAYALLGAVKSRMALGDVGFGHQQITLPNGAVIRVLRNGSQNIVEIDVSTPSQEITEKAVKHGFCFFPKTLDDPNGWVYENGRALGNLKKGFEAYYGRDGGRCFGVARYAFPPGKPPQVVGRFGVPTLSGNQFFVKGQDVYSWVHSAAGDLPLLTAPDQPLYIPFLSTPNRDTKGFWLVGDLRRRAIPNSVFKNGSLIFTSSSDDLVLGVCEFSRQVIVIFTSDCRTIKVGIIEDESTVTPFFIDNLYPAKDGYLTGKAYISEDGSHFSIIASHLDPKTRITHTDINDYALSVDEDTGAIAGTKIAVVRFVAADKQTGTSTVVTTQSYSGDVGLKSYPDRSGWLYQTRSGGPPYGPWLWSDGQEPEEPTRNGSGTYQRVLVNTIPTVEIPVAVVYTSSTQYDVVSISYTLDETRTDGASNSTHSSGSLHLYSASNTTRRWLMMFDSHANGEESSIYHLATSVVLKKAGQVICRLKEEKSDESYKKDVQNHSFINATTGYTQAGSTSTATSSASATRSLEETWVLFFDFKTLNHVRYVKTTETTTTNNQSAVSTYPASFGSNYQQMSTTTTTSTRFELKLFTGSDRTLYTHGTSDSDSTSGTGIDGGLASYRFINESINTTESSALSADPPRLISFMSPRYGPMTVVSDQREFVKAHGFLIYDLLFYPWDNLDDKKVYCFHGDSMGGVVDKLPFATDEVFSHVVGLF